MAGKDELIRLSGYMGRIKTGTTYQYDPSKPKKVLRFTDTGRSGAVSEREFWIVDLAEENGAVAVILLHPQDVSEISKDIATEERMAKKYGAPIPTKWTLTGVEVAGKPSIQVEGA